MYCNTFLKHLCIMFKSKNFLPKNALHLEKGPWSLTTTGNQRATILESRKNYHSPRLAATHWCVVLMSLPGIQAALSKTFLLLILLFIFLCLLPPNNVFWQEWHVILLESPVFLNLHILGCCSGCEWEEHINGDLAAWIWMNDWI